MIAEPPNAASAARRERFEALFGRPPQRAARAPGRVNLIGEHTDYNDGYVLPIAIERETVALAAARDDAVVRLASMQSHEQAELRLDGPIEPAAPAWANYPRGVAAGLKDAGVELRGADLLFDRTVPLGGGLSSSASLEVAAATVLLAVARKVGSVRPGDLARICQQAEHEFAGAPCGIMDQSIAILGQAGRALLLDCRSGQTRQVPFDDPGLVLLVADTQVKHDIADGGYATRRSQCESAAGKLGLDALRDATPEHLRRAEAENLLTDKELMRARHIVTEIARTLDAVAALEAGDFARFGELMYGSHASLRDDYEVSCEELDAVVEIARGLEGCYGARMTGGGFGGCAIVLADAARSDDLQAALAAGFADRFGRACPVFATRACDGASVLE